MSSRNRRTVNAEDMFPGMPDILGKKPPKATENSWAARTLDEAIARSYELLDQAIVGFSTGDVISGRKKWVNNPDYFFKRGAPRQIQMLTPVNHGPRELAGVFGLYSGGRDSVNTMHLLRKYMKDRPLFRHFFQGIAHVNTGTAVAETTQHVREAVPAWGMKLHELTPKVTYLDLVLGNVRATVGPNIGRSVWLGFPGPGKLPHNVMYRRLKDEPLQRLRASLVGRDGTRRKAMYVGGMRWDESDKRFRTAEEIDVDGGIVWVSPVAHWTNAHMREYRARYRCEKAHRHQPHRLCGDEALPVNPVTENLHMSGDCACGKKHDPERTRKQQRCPRRNGDHVSKIGEVVLVATPRDPINEGDFVTAASLPPRRLIAMCPECHDAVRRAIKRAEKQLAPAMDDLFDVAEYRVAPAIKGDAA